MVDRNSRQAEQSGGGVTNEEKRSNRGQDDSAYQGAAKQQLDRTLPMIAYIMFLVAPVTAGVSLLFGGAIAIYNRGEKNPIIYSHYSNMITALLVSIVAVLVASFTWFWGVGLVIYVAWMIWVVLRAVVGMSFLNRGESVAQPQSWWLGKETS